MRGEAPGDTLRPLTPSPIRESTYRDTTVQPGARYVYAVVAVDKAGNASPPSTRVEGGRDDARRAADRSVRIFKEEAMKIFIDSGNLKDIEALVPLGIIDGITTNPSLLAKEGGDYRADPQEDLPHREGPGQRRGRRDRRRRR